MSNANPLELTMLNSINDERETAGLEQLRLITTLNDAAETHSGWMLDADVFSHSGAGGSSPSDRMAEAGYLFEGNSLALENIGWQSARGAEGYEDDVAQIHEGLMESPGHRANILNPDAQDIGIGVEIGTYSDAGSDYEAVMVTQTFGATDADISFWVDPGTGVADDDEVIADDTPEEDDIVAENDFADDGDDIVTDEDTQDDGEDVVAEDDGEPSTCDTDDPTEPVVDVVTGENDEMDGPIAGPVEVTDEDIADEETPDMEEPAESDGEDVAEEIPEDNEDFVAGDDSDPVEGGPDDTIEDDQDTDGADDDLPDEDASEDTETDEPTLADFSLPCDLADFRVDLTSAFDFRQEGDQLIWETSEDRLMEVFMKAFEGWAGGQMEESGAAEADISDLMVDNSSAADIEWVPDDEDPMDDWMASCGI